MASPKIQSLNELSLYLDNLERRIISLENENKELKALVNDLNADHKDLSDYVDESIPDTGILSKNFLKRAFSIWGHYFVAQLLIAITLFAVYFFAVILILKSFMR